MPGPGGPNQPVDACGVEADYHSGALYRVVFELQPTLGPGMPFRFIRPLWEEEATLCEYHLYPPEFSTSTGEQPVYRLGVASDEGIPLRLIWKGEIVSE